MARRIDPALIPANPNLSFELGLWEVGCTLVAGVDEAGRGAWAGPVTAAAVVLSPDPTCLADFDGVRDSKTMSPNQRTLWASHLRDLVSDWSLGTASPGEVDRLGLIPATRLAMQRAISALQSIPDHLLLDYILIPNCEVPQTSLVKGDARSLSIAAASILAKDARDQTMRNLGVQYPDYGFARHKGYGTAAHREALVRFGPTPIHRQTYEPVQRLRSLN